MLFVSHAHLKKNKKREIRGFWGLSSLSYWTWQTLAPRLRGHQAPRGSRMADLWVGSERVSSSPQHANTQEELKGTDK